MPTAKQTKKTAAARSKKPIAKPKAATPVRKPATAKKPQAVAVDPREEKRLFGLVVVWLCLIIVFLGMVITQLYLQP